MPNGINGKRYRRDAPRRDALLGNNELDKAIGRASGFSSHLETGQRVNPRGNVLEKIAEVTKVSVMWLTYGKGEMHDQPTRAVERDVPTYSEAEVYFADAIERAPCPTYLSDTSCH